MNDHPEADCAHGLQRRLLMVPTIDTETVADMVDQPSSGRRRRAIGQRE